MSDNDTAKTLRVPYTGFYTVTHRPT